MSGARLRFDAREWIGAFGDIGTLVPIVLSVSVVNGVDLGKTLLVMGASYVLAGLLFRLPVPVQPLKAMAAIALSQGLSSAVIQAGALWVGVIFLVLAVTGWARRLEAFFPQVVVKGVQFGVGLLLIQSAVKLIQPVSGPVVPFFRPAPAISMGDFLPTFFLLVLPQIPLTLGNSVFAAKDALRSYFPTAGSRVSARALCASIGAGNLVAGLLGGYPLCHGSGGVTAHVRFGARTGGASVVMGGALLTLSFGLWGNGFEVLAAIPRSFLGTLLAFVGFSHVRLSLKGAGSSLKAAAMLAGTVGFLMNSLAWTLVVGWVLEAARQAAEEGRMNRLKEFLRRFVESWRQVLYCGRFF